MPLKIPICTFDAKTGILCAKCESKLKSGQITQADVDVSRALVQLSDKIGEINKVSLVRAVSAGGSYVMEVEDSNVPMLRSKPDIHAKLEQQLKGRLWVVGATASERQFLEDLFFPIQVLTVNTVWRPDGGKVTKAIVVGRRGDRSFAEADKLKQVAKMMKGMELVVENESEAFLRN